MTWCSLVYFLSSGFMVWENISGMFETTASVCGLFLWSISLSMQLSLLFLSVCWHVSLSWGGWGPTVYQELAPSINPPVSLKKELKMSSKQKKSHQWTQMNLLLGKTTLLTEIPESQLSAEKKLWCKVWVFSWAGSSEWSLWWTPAGLRQRALSPFWAHLHTKWRQRKHVSH